MQLLILASTALKQWMIEWSKERSFDNSSLLLKNTNGKKRIMRVAVVSLISDCQSIIERMTESRKGEKLFKTWQ